MTDIKVGSTIKMNQKVGKGAFGDIYQGVYGNIQVAIKLEPIQSKTPSLLQEAKFYQQLHKDKNAKQHFPEIYYCTTEASNRLLIMQLLGPSIEHLFQACNRQFSLKTVMKIGLQCLSRIEYLHSQNLIHRDVKPENFLLGLDNMQGQIFMIDLGLAKTFNVNGQHIQYKEKLGLTGTCRYSSINAHSGKQASRRDDLESFGFMMIYLLKGSLPWQGEIDDDKDDKFEKVLKKKKSLSLEQLCEGCPAQFLDFLIYVRNMRFDERPDYLFIKRLFQDLIDKLGIRLDENFDWQELAVNDTI